MKIIRKDSPDTIFPYIAYISDDLSDHPALIVQLHGAGQRGSGGEALENVLVYGFPLSVNDNNLHDCILLFPQCPWDSFWVAKIESLKRFLDGFVQEYSIDPDRISLCGISMGGYGTWYTAMAYPDYFAAIAPCCGGGMAWNASVLNMPIWTFHGKEDIVVSPTQTIEMVEKLKVNGNINFTFYDGVGHDCSSLAFTEELLQWLLAQHK